MRYPELLNITQVFVHTAEAQGEGEVRDVSGYGIVQGLRDATDDGDQRVTVEMWIPEADLWAKLGERVYWSGDDESDEWEQDGRSPAIVTVPRRDVFRVADVGLELDPDSPRPA